MFWERFLFFLQDVCGRGPPPVARHRGARPLWTDPGLAGCGPGPPPMGPWTDLGVAAWQMILTTNPRRKRKRRSHNHHRNNLTGPPFFWISWLGVVCPTPFNDGCRARCFSGPVPSNAVQRWVPFNDGCRSTMGAVQRRSTMGAAPPEMGALRPEPGGERLQFLKRLQLSRSKEPP